MGLFSYNYYDDKPPKTIFGRLWRILTEHFGGLLGSGALAAVSCIPYVVGLVISIDTHALLPMAVVCPLGGVLAAPQLCGLTDLVLRALRDEPGKWWPTYRRAWKQNLKSCILPGLIGGLLFSVQLFLYAHVNIETIDLMILAVMAVGTIVSTALATWMLPQLVLMDLSFGQALRNAVLLCGRSPLKTIGTVLLQLAYWGLIVIGVPDTLVLFALLTFWAPALIVTTVIYPTLEEAFHTEDKIEEKRKAEGTDIDFY